MIAVLLATYNGARWLSQFLESLQGQKVSNWTLLVRDDGSTDVTREILAGAAWRDRRLVILRDDLGPLGVTRNFGALMEEAQRRRADRVFFADQDDVWLPDKLERQLCALESAESGGGGDLPILVHSDLAVVDWDLRPIHPFHSRYAGIDCKGSGEEALRRLLMHNFVTGCAMLINRPLLELCLPMPREAVLHDWWCAVCAAASGELIYLPQATVLYRQHGANVVGARSVWQRINPVYGKRRWARAQINFAAGIEQTKALARRLEERRPGADAYQIVRDYSEVFYSERGAWNRLRRLHRMNVGRPGALNRTLLAAQLLSLPRAG